MTNHDNYTSSYLSEILRTVKTIAVVGASDDPGRPSNEVMRFLHQHGYRVFAVSPKLLSGAVAGVPVYRSLAEVPEPIDMVDVFRNNAAVEAVVDDALALTPLPKVIWMQIGVRVDAAADRAEAHGISVVMNRCPKIDYLQLLGHG